MYISVFYDHILDISKELGLDINDTLLLIKEQGIDYVEIEKERLNDSHLCDMLYGNSLKVSCIIERFNFTHGEDGNNGFSLIDTAVNNNVQNVLVIPGFYNEQDNFYLIRDNVRNALQTMCDYASDKNVNVTIEDYDDIQSPVSRLCDVKWMLENVNGLRLTFDTGNFIYNNENSVRAYNELKKYITHFHFKDKSISVKYGTPAFSAVGVNLYPAAVGNGVIDMNYFIRELVSAKYTGTITIEHYGIFNQYKAVKESVHYIKRSMQN